MRVVEGREEALRLFAERSAVGSADEVARAVREVIEAVRSGGDQAVISLGARFDGVRVEGLKVPAAAFDEAERSVSIDLRQGIELAVERVTAFYRNQPAQGFMLREGDAVLGQLVRPLRRVGCYVPGGTAPLFSTLLMTAVPARVAGVEEIVVATPPASDGSVAPEILVAAKAAGVDAVYRAGGAQAIAALALGTETIERVDKVVGPGNRFVVEAKRALYGEVGIEALPGPTETLVLADGSASPAQVAADLLAQAEHVGAQPVLVTTSRELANGLPAVLDDLLHDLPTAAYARESLEERGVVVLVRSLEEGVEVANDYAPEHLCLLVERPEDLLPAVRNAGGVFLGHSSMEALGDYLAGPSHVMPTGGTARFSSALNVADFQRLIPIVGVSAELLERIGPAAAVMARAEGLEAHARAIESRLDD